MRKIKRLPVSGALLLVFISLLGASLACYSGQVPGIESDVYVTITPLPPANNAKFALMQEVLAPREPGLQFFDMTIFPEPIQEPNRLNADAQCQPNSPATILYAGQGDNGVTYYLVNCTGSVGWASEDRLAGPLEFIKDELALTVSADGQPLELLDQNTFEPMMFSFTPCMPETIVTVQELAAEDADQDGARELYYLIECPVGNKGWVGNDDLFGPLRVDVNDQALAISQNPAAAYVLTTDPAPATVDNLVEGTCPEETVVDVKEARLVEDTIYYRVDCATITGWTPQANLVGPLLFQPEQAAIIYVPPVLMFEDDLPDSAGGTVSEAAPAATETPEPTTDDDAAAADTAPAGDASEEEIARTVEYIGPAYLTSAPAEPVTIGDAANVVGTCPSGEIAQIMTYTGVNETLYYQIECATCTEYGIDDDGSETCLTTEPLSGWINQSLLQGPLEFVPGEQVHFKSSSQAIMTDETDGAAYARVPVTTDGAGSLGRFTEYAGRCPVENAVEITGAFVEKSPTSNRFTFYYKLACTGQPSIIEFETTDAGSSQPITTYQADTETLITGIALGRDLEYIE